MKCSKEIILEMEMIKERSFTTSVICVQGYATEAGFHFNFKVAELGVCPTCSTPTAGYLQG